jgi:pimeloyl-ACP methyl ester carboxylesterase
VNSVISPDGARIAYETTGSGPPIVLIDGALCSRALGPMKALAHRLARKFTVIHYDRRGRNDSGDTPGYTVQKEIDDLAAVIKANGGSAMVFGLSSGAALALRAAEQGIGIQKVAAYEPPFFLDESRRARAIEQKTQLERLIQADRRSEAVKYFQVQIVGLPSLLSTILRLTPLWSKFKSVAPTLVYDLEVLNGGAVPEGILARLELPVLAIAGEKSPQFLVEAATAVASHVRHAQCIVLPGQNHNFKAEAVAPVLEEFFSRANP